LTRVFPRLDDAFSAVIRDYTAGDPMLPQARWTNLSLRRIRADLIGRGFRIGVKSVAKLLRRFGFGRRKAQKKLSAKRHPQQDQQFRNIARLRAEYESSPNPIISVDTKKKEFIGNLYREGRLYTQETIRTLDHDFPTSADGVAYPHGIYDPKRNVGHINLGTSHDTSRFACDSIGHWWEKHGRAAYPQAKSILLLCDGGGSNSSRRYVFKYHLERLADRLQIEIRVAHYPPGCSKYDPIEHRFFPHVTRACQGLVFTTIELIQKKMGETQTTKGLRATVEILLGDYPTGEKVPDGYKASMRIVFDEELPAWNYRAIPRKPGS
jgi:Rhodopirellula transposase DDE domain